MINFSSKNQNNPLNGSIGEIDSPELNKRDSTVLQNYYDASERTP